MYSLNTNINVYILQSRRFLLRNFFSKKLFENSVNEPFEKRTVSNVTYIRYFISLSTLPQSQYLNTIIYISYDQQILLLIFFRFYIVIHLLY